MAWSYEDKNRTGKVQQMKVLKIKGINNEILSLSQVNSGEDKVLEILPMKNMDDFTGDSIRNLDGFGLLQYLHVYYTGHELHYEPTIDDFIMACNSIGGEVMDAEVGQPTWVIL